MGGDALNIRLGRVGVAEEGETAARRGGEVTAGHWCWRRSGGRRKRSAELRPAPEEERGRGGVRQHWRLVELSCCYEIALSSFVFLQNNKNPFRTLTF